MVCALGQAVFFLQWTPSVRSASKPEGYFGNRWNLIMFWLEILKAEEKEEQLEKHSLTWTLATTRRLLRFFVFFFAKSERFGLPLSKDRHVYHFLFRTLLV